MKFNSFLKLLFKLFAYFQGVECTMLVSDCTHVEPSSNLKIFIHLV